MYHITAKLVLTQRHSSDLRRQCRTASEPFCEHELSICERKQRREQHSLLKNAFASASKQTREKLSEASKQEKIIFACSQCLKALSVRGRGFLPIAWYIGGNASFASLSTFWLSAELRRRGHVVLIAS